MDLPLKILQKSKGKLVFTKLKNGIEYNGRLDQCDNFMNIVLEEVEEITDDTIIKYSKALVRGNNILYIKIQ